MSLYFHLFRSSFFFPLTQGGKNEHQETEEKFAPVTGELVTLLADPGGPVRPVSSKTAGDLSWGQVKDMCSLQVDAIRQLDHFYFFAFISFWRCNMRMLNPPANHAHHQSTARAGVSVIFQPVQKIGCLTDPARVDLVCDPVEPGRLVLKGG